jgi:prophage DNA circulation protein
MVALRDLQPSSYRGVRFLVPKDKAEEGRKSIPHHYPDSPVRYVEDNGYCPPEFELSIVLHGRNLLSDWAELRAALNRPGPGTLMHPWYGPQFCSVMGPWKVTREDGFLGELHLEVKFSVTGPPSFPGLVTGIAAAVTGLSAQFLTQLFSAFTGRFGLPVSPVSAAVVIAEFGTLARTASALFGASPGIPDAVRHLTADAFPTLSSPLQLNADLSTVFRAPFEDRSHTGAELVTAYTRLDATFDDMAYRASLIPTDTADYATRRASLAHLSATGQTACLAVLAEAMAGRAYISAQAVHADEAFLDARLAAAIARDLDHDQVMALTQLVLSAQAVLRKDALRLPLLDELRIPDAPASWLAYMLDDDMRRLDTLCDLNDDQPPILLTRRAVILREAA